MNDLARNALAPAPLRIDIRRGSIVAFLVGTPLLIALTAALVYSVIDANDRPTALIGTVFTVLSGGLLLFVLLAIPKALVPRGLVFDERGVRYWRGASWAFLPWESLTAIGIGYEQPPDLPTLSLADYVREKMVNATIDPKRRIALEIFPVDPRFLEQQKLLLHFRKEGPPPAPGLSAARWRVPLPPFSGLAMKVGQAVQTFQPGRWIGWFARPWRILGI